MLNELPDLSRLLDSAPGKIEVRRRNLDRVRSACATRSGNRCSLVAPSRIRKNSSSASRCLLQP